MTQDLRQQNTAKPAAVVHIGFNKCGSTAIQKWLADNRAALMSHGLLYRRSDPREDVICANQQFAILAQSLGGSTLVPRRINEVLGITPKDRVSQDQVAFEFAADVEARVAMADFDTYVVSCEHLCGRMLTSADIAAFDAWLHSVFSEVKYVVYVRRPDTWLVSLFGQVTRLQDAKGTFDVFLEKMLQIPYLTVLKRWSDAVGADALDVRLFDENWTRDHGLLDDFSSVLGVPDVTVQRKDMHVNKTEKSEGWLARLLGRGVGRETVKPTPEQLARIGAAYKDPIDWMSEQFFKGQGQRVSDWARLPQTAAAGRGRFPS